MSRLAENFNQNAVLHKPMLDTDKIESLEDCKKILSFICNRILQPIPEGVEYVGFSEVKEYFK